MKINSDISVLIQQIKIHEPRLKKSEKAELWNRIQTESETRSRKLKKMRWTAIAAAVALLLVGSWMLHIQTDHREQLFSDLRLDGMENISLYFNNGCIELEQHATITCIPNEKTLEIRQGNTVSRVRYEQEEGTIILAVPARHKANIVLADGSAVTMNGGSKILVPLDINKTERNIAFDGEAYMKIHHDAQRPFRAQTNGLTVKVLGTEFLLSAYGDRNIQSVTLIEGCVEVTPGRGIPVRMSPNQTYSYNVISGKAKVKAESNTKQLTIWKDDLLLLHDERLITLLQRIETLYGVRFTYNIQQVSDIRLNGKLDTSVGIEQVLARIAKIAPVRIEKRDDGYHIIKNLK